MKKTAGFRLFAFLLLVYICIPTIGNSEPKVHALLVFCDGYPSDAGAINESVTTDRGIVVGSLRENINEQSWGVDLKILEISGSDATEDLIFKALATISEDVGPLDTVFVHFSGHGVILDRSTDEQFLQGCDLELFRRKKWADQIDALPARLKIFVTDCCSSYPVEELAEGPEEVNPWNSYYHLFMLHEGFVDITAASPGEAAYGTERGGYLTVNLHSDIQRYKSWETVFQRTSNRVFEETSSDPDILSNPTAKPQKPMAYSLGSRLFDVDDADAPVPAEVKYVMPDSDSTLLSLETVRAMTSIPLYFGRNEIFARHGYDFSTPLLQYYFGDRSWYKRIEGFKTPELSDIEKANLAIIDKVEAEKGGRFDPEGFVIPGISNTTDEFPDIFPRSSQQQISRVAVQNLNRMELSIARNEIFARHGFPFSNPKLSSYFANKSYYTEIPTMKDPDFNSFEKYNIWLIQKIERLKGGAYAW